MLSYQCIVSVSCWYLAGTFAGVMSCNADSNSSAVVSFCLYLFVSLAVCLAVLLSCYIFSFYSCVVFSFIWLAVWLAVWAAYFLTYVWRMFDVWLALYFNCYPRYVVILPVVYISSN